MKYSTVLPACPLWAFARMPTPPPLFGGCTKKVAPIALSSRCLCQFATDLFCQRGMKWPSTTLWLSWFYLVVVNSAFFLIDRWSSYVATTPIPLLHDGEATTSVNLLYSVCWYSFLFKFKGLLSITHTLLYSGIWYRFSKTSWYSFSSLFSRLE